MCSWIDVMCEVVMCWMSLLVFSNPHLGDRTCVRVWGGVVEALKFIAPQHLQLHQHSLQLTHRHTSTHIQHINTSHITHQQQCTHTNSSANAHHCINTSSHISINQRINTFIKVSTHQPHQHINTSILHRTEPNNGRFAFHFSVQLNTTFALFYLNRSCS
jgi:hypothetical protein